MRKGMAGLFVLFTVVGSTDVLAAQVLLPATVGESEASAKQRLGEPESVYFDDVAGANELYYKSRGFTVTVFAQMGTVASASVLGNHHDPAAGTYSGGIIDGLDMNSTAGPIRRKVRSRRVETGPRHQRRDALSVEGGFFYLEDHRMGRGPRGRRRGSSERQHSLGRGARS